MVWHHADGGSRGTEPGGAGGARVGHHGDRLFVHADVYQWRSTYGKSSCWYFRGVRERGLQLTDRLPALSDLPPAIRARVLGYRRFFVDHPPRGVSDREPITGTT